MRWRILLHQGLIRKDLSTNIKPFAVEDRGLSANLYSLIQSRFPANHEQVLIETGTGRTYSYADLERESARYARFFADLGLVKGDRVVAQLDKSPEVLFLYLGCLRAGLIYLPLNTAYRKAELEYFLSDAEPRAIVCAPQLLPALQALAEAQGITHVFTLDQAGGGSLQTQSADTSATFEPVICTADDVAAILYTSGTTGRPKGAMISHSNLSSNALALQEAWGWRSDDVLLHALPLYHVHGLFVACHCVLFGGSRMLMLDKFDSRKVLELLPRVTVMMGVPTFYTRLLAEPDFGSAQSAHMRLFISGSAPLLEQTFSEFQARTGHAILERYGMTETGMNTSNPLRGDRLPSTVGLPLPGVAVRVVDESGADVAAGDVGLLLVKGPNVFQGYWRMPEKTAEEFTEEGFFKTGDLASIGPQGYVSIVGRGKDLIITGGLNVYPKEVERFIDDLDGVFESAVIGLPHADFGESVNAVVVRDNSSPPVTEDAIISVLKDKLAGFKVPKQVFFVDELPRNAMGKVQKNVLRERYQKA